MAETSDLGGRTGDLLRRGDDRMDWYLSVFLAAAAVLGGIYLLMPVGRAGRDRK
jgi:hypothetical protein